MNESNKMPSKYIDKNIADLVKSFIDKQVNRTNMVFYNGKVVDNDDPLRQGRCKIRVYGIHSDEIPDGDLPWAEMEQSFVGSTLGNMVIPPVDAIVKVIFDKDDIYSPRYTSKVLHTQSLLELSTNTMEDYPDSMVFFQTDAGEYFKINRSTNVSTYRHASGLVIRVEADGSCTIDNEGTETGNITINTGGDIEVNCGGSADVIAQNNVSVKSTLGEIHLAGGEQYVNNLPACLYNGAPHFTLSSVTPGKAVKVSA